MSTPPTDPAPKPGPPPSHQPDPPADPPKTDPRDEPKFSQADVDRIIAGRLAPVKEKADAYDKQIEAAKTDAQRQQDELDKMRAENAVLKAAQARRDAAMAANLPASAIGLVTGDTPEQIDLSVKAVQALIQELGAPRTPAPDPSAGRVPQDKHSGDWLRDGLNRH